MLTLVRPSFAAFDPAVLDKDQGEFFLSNMEVSRRSLLSRSRSQPRARPRSPLMVCYRRMCPQVAVVLSKIKEERAKTGEKVPECVPVEPPFFVLHVQ